MGGPSSVIRRPVTNKHQAGRLQERLQLRASAVMDEAVKGKVEDKADAWQRIAGGLWWGRPAIFDREGTFQGLVKAVRKSEADGIEFFHRYMVPNRGKALEFGGIELRTANKGDCRVYLGKDLYGYGVPYGNLLLGNVYNHAWKQNLHVWVQIMPDNITQAYTNVLFVGPNMEAGTCGIYQRDDSYYTDTTNATQQRIEEFLQFQEVESQEPYVIPPYPTHYKGRVQVWSADQQLHGETDLSIEWEPTYDFYHFVEKVKLGGLEGFEGGMARFLETDGDVRYGVELDNNYERHALYHSWHHRFQGPPTSAWGNGRTFGRCMYFTQNVHHTPVFIQGRNYIVYKDSIAVAWEFHTRGERKWVVHGLLDNVTNK
ncbi:unnamed protein product [Vitrella brassicaformis CCMP3155]|uniref:Uncharacterized protein n=1 Tax=Vitrella brassicaformis (strain CCMP3155) TaxID=1169540 RepID=A0A0G4EM44_VITBC|nr:unnamed protein product [Vitrella brassicaformis CCMP3155]|eukprot:CEL98218.1 unnamed protein product [Vitrella brassicaformis CCMP3155]